MLCACQIHIEQLRKACRSCKAELYGKYLCVPGTALTAIVAARVPPGAAVSPLAGPPELEDTLDTQRERVRAVSPCFSSPWFPLLPCLLPALAYAPQLLAVPASCTC